MPTKFISSEITSFFSGSNTSSYDFKLIYGDEIKTTGVKTGSRSEAVYRGRHGWVKSNQLMDKRTLEMYFIDVGQGDSTFIITPNNKKILIDGGKGNEAFQFLVWRYRLDKPNPKTVNIDLLVVTHTDDDHLKGLISIIKHQNINVKRIIHSGIAKYKAGFNTDLGQKVTSGGKKYLVTRHDSIADLNGQNLKKIIADWKTAIENEPNVTYEAVDSTSPRINIGDASVKINVLGPKLVNIPGQANPVFPWLSSDSETVNGHSVVLRIDYKNVSILLPGDINTKGCKHLLDDPNIKDQLPVHIFKAPHHGSNHYDRKFLEEVNPQVSVISSGESPDHGHPRANFLGAVGNVARSKMPLLFSTELVAQFTADEDATAEADDDTEVDPTDASKIGQARKRFKKNLNGIINVRTDGDTIYCARRVAASYQFVTYKQNPAPADN